MGHNDLLDMLNKADENGEIFVVDGRHFFENNPPASEFGYTWNDIYAGDVYFLLPNNWIVVVFNDCDEWDYIDSFISPGINSQRYNLWGVPDCEHIWELRNWEPKNMDKWTNAQPGTYVKERIGRIL